MIWLYQLHLLGFGNNIMILLFTLEIVLVVLFIERLVPTCIEKLVWNN